MSESNEPVANSAALLSDAALRHGIDLTTEQVALAAEWRAAMESAVEAVRDMDVEVHEPAAVFHPVSTSRLTSGG